MPKQLVITPAGERMVDLTPAESAALATDQAECADRVARRSARQAARDAAAPDATIRAKLKAGANTTAAETAQLVRWIALMLDPTVAE